MSHSIHDSFVSPNQSQTITCGACDHPQIVGQGEVYKCVACNRGTIYHWINDCVATQKSRKIPLSDVLLGLLYFKNEKLFNEAKKKIEDGESFIKVMMFIEKNWYK